MRHELAQLGEYLSGYIDGELTQQQRQWVELHCDNCAQCARELDELTALRRRIGETRLSEVGKDILAGLRNIVGGEVHEYGKLIAESREQSLDRMVTEAAELGANAVIATRFTTSVMMGGAAELLAIGTAVIVEDT